MWTECEIVSNVSTDQEFVNERDRAKQTLRAAYVAALISGVSDEEMQLIENEARTETDTLFADMVAHSRARLAAITGGSRALHVVRPGAHEHPAQFDNYGQRAA